MKKLLLFFTLFLFFQTAFSQTTTSVDILVYGGTSGGVIAAYSAKKSGKSVLLVEPGNHLGGLSSGGLGYTDIGNKYAVTGLALDFYRRIGKHYGKFEQWIFEPHVAEDLFKDYVTRGAVNVLYGHSLVSVQKENKEIKEITIESSDNSGKVQKIRAKVFIDCSYEGDLMAKAGVSYVIGREDNNEFGETYNGVQVMEKHQFPDGVDPYKIPGKPESGLLWGISPLPVDSKGKGDKKVQAYNFRICLTNKKDNLIPITRPENYDSTKYELLLRYLEKKPARNLWSFLKFDLMPNNKTDINNNGPFSTDMIGMNYNYPEADYDERKKIIKDHEAYNKGLLYFIGHDPRMPEHLRNLMLEWGYPKDEYTDNGNWSPQLYVREARRMRGAYVMTQANCQGKETVKDGVGLAAYTMDSHNCQRLVINGMVKNEGDVQIGGFGPYPISYGSLIPKASECINLLVPVCLSATHIAYGSIRMEPVFMVLGQSSAVAASMAIDRKTSVQNVDITALQKTLKEDPLLDGSTPEIIVDNEDKAQVTIKGEWTVEKKGFGLSALSSQSDSKELKSVRFSPASLKGGQYSIYAYFPKNDKSTTLTTVVVYDGKTSKESVVKKENLKVEGQTSGEWIPLGDYKIEKGQKPFVEISTKNADGIVLADAILFVPEE